VLPVGGACPPTGPTNVKRLCAACGSAAYVRKGSIPDITFLYERLLYALAERLPCKYVRAVRSNGDSPSGGARAAKR